MADPATITGLIRRWRAASIAQADASAVSSWTALTGGVALAQATGGNQPTYKTAIVNGQPVVRFNGTTSYLTATITSQAQPTTLSVVLKWGSVAAASQVVDAGHTQQLIILPAGYDGWAGVDLANATTPTVGTWYVVTYVANGASSAIYLNGTSIASGNSGTSGLGASLFVAVQNNLTRFMNGDIAEIFAYSAALGSTDRSTLHSYVQDLYGITVSDYVASGTPVALSETGGFTDGLAITSGIPLPETVTATDALTVPTQTRVLTDTGAGTDAIRVGPIITDTGGFTDGLAITSKGIALADSAGGSEFFDNSGAVPSHVASYSTVTDTGRCVSTLVPTVEFSTLTDAGQATSTLAPATEFSTLTDAGQATSTVQNFT